MTLVVDATQAVERACHAYYSRRRLNLVHRRAPLPSTKLSKLELNIMEALWTPRRVLHP